jgi:hypothetical protein
MNPILHSWALEKATRRWAFANNFDHNRVLFVQLPVTARAEIIRMAEELQATEAQC